MCVGVWSVEWQEREVEEGPGNWPLPAPCPSVLTPQHAGSLSGIVIVSLLSDSPSVSREIAVIPDVYTVFCSLVKDNDEEPELRVQTGLGSSLVSTL